MSFQTTLSFYRPAAPPKMSCVDLSAFVARFDTLGLSDGKGPFGYRVKFGRAIDQDERPTTWNEPVIAGGFISVVREIEYDAEDRSLSSLPALALELAGLDGTVYRASLLLGGVERSVYEHLRYEPSDESDVGLYLESWCLEIEPIFTYDLTTETPFMVGWIAASLSGRGYLHDWTFRELIQRAEALEPVRALQRLCRSVWPVAGKSPPRRIAKARKAMGPLWPYDTPDLPWDWCWGLCETG